MNRWDLILHSIGVVFSAVLLYYAFDIDSLGWIFAVGAFVLYFQIISVQKKRISVRLWFHILFILSFVILQYSFIIKLAFEYDLLSLTILLIIALMYLLPIVILDTLSTDYGVEVFSISFLMAEYMFVNSPIGNQMFQLGVVLADNVIFSQFCEYTGPWGGSAWIIFESYCLYRVLNGDFYKLKSGIIVFLLTLIVNMMILNNLQTEMDDDVTITAASLLESNDIDSLLLTYDKTSDYLLLPEATKIIHGKGLATDPFMTYLYRLSDKTKSHIVAGIYVYEGDIRYNKVYGIKENICFSRGKSILVPFAEYLPFSSSLNNFVTKISQILPHPTHKYDNKEEIYSDVNVKYAPIICYEALFTDYISDLCRKGAELIFVSSSNTFIGDDHIESVNQKIIRMNAVVARRCFVRATEYGRSFFINRDGGINKECKYKSCFLTSNVEINSENTIYVLYGNLISHLYILLLMIAFVSIMRRIYCQSGDNLMKFN